MSDRIEELSEEIASVFRYMFGKLPFIKMASAEINKLSEAESHDLTIILSEKLIEVSPIFMGIQDLIPAIMRKDYATANQLFQNMMHTAMPNARYSIGNVLGHTHGVSGIDDAMSEILNVAKNSPQQMRTDSWGMYLIERFTRAEKEGSVAKNPDGSTGHPFFQCQVRLHGDNLGVGTLAPSEWPVTGKGHGLLMHRAANPITQNNRTQIIATTTHFEISDIKAITELDATAMEMPKDEKKIWMG